MPSQENIHNGLQGKMNKNQPLTISFQLSVACIRSTLKDGHRD
jgi:hypothetical protein